VLLLTNQRISHCPSDHPKIQRTIPSHKKSALLLLCALHHALRFLRHLFLETARLHAASRRDQAQGQRNCEMHCTACESMAALI
jgi:hypothetical protein